MCLEFSPGLFLLQLGSPGSEVFLKLPRFRDEAVGNAYNFSLCCGIALRGRIINALIQPRVEAFEWFVGIEGLRELPVVLRHFHRQYPRVVRVEVAAEGQCGGSGVASESVLRRGEVCVIKCREKLIPEGSVDVTTLIVLLTLFGVLVEESLLVRGGCPFRDVGCATGIGWADERVSGDKGILGRRQDDTDVAVLASTAWTLDRRRVRGEDTMGVLDRAIYRFPRMLGEGWGR